MHHSLRVLACLVSSQFPIPCSHESGSQPLLELPAPKGARAMAAARCVLPQREEPAALPFREKSELLSVVCVGATSVGGRQFMLSNS